MGKLVAFIGRRLALGVLTLFLVSILVFSAVEMLPGDIATEVLGASATEETLAAFRRERNLEGPAYTRYVQWLSGFVTGDLGKSLANHRDIAEMIGPRVRNTLFLALFSAVIAIPLALALGLLCALYAGSLFDKLVNIITLSFISLPEFLIGYVLIVVFAVQLGWAPSLSSVALDAGWGELIERSILPATTLVLVSMAGTMRMVRAAITNLMASPYIEMAYLKGISRTRVVIQHALPNAIAPVINVVALNLAYLIVGVVVVEVVFVFPGLGQLIIDSVQRRDIFVVQACSLIFAATYVVLNMTADILSIMSNPRMMHPR